MADPSPARGERASGPPLYSRYLHEELQGLAALGTDRDTFQSRLAALVDLAAPDRAALTVAFNDLYVELAPPLSAVLVGARMPFGAFEIVDYLGASCATVGEMFTRVTRYLRLLRTPVELGLRRAGPVHVLELRGAHEAPAYYFEEFTAGVMLGRVRELVDPAFCYTSAWFSRAPPPEIAGQLRTLLRCPLRFDAGATRVEISADIWNAPALRPNSSLYAALEPVAESMLAGAAFSERVRLAATQALRGGDARIEAVARVLGLTPRTLQRRLQDEGLRYQEIVDAARGALAQQMLADPSRGLDDLAEALGYADAGSFSRAFRRWYGCSPAEYRQRLRARPQR